MDKKQKIMMAVAGVILVAAIGLIVWNLMSGGGAPTRPSV